MTLDHVEHRIQTFVVPAGVVQFGGSTEGYFPDPREDEPSGGVLSSTRLYRRPPSNDSLVMSLHACGNARARGPMVHARERTLRQHARDGEQIGGTGYEESVVRACDQSALVHRRRG